MRRFAVVACLIVWSGAVLAQPAGAQAEVLFDQGRSLMAQGKLAEACNAFDESQKLEPANTTLVALAACREHNNQLATAWGVYLDVERQTRSATDAAGQQLHDLAQDRAKKLAARVSKLTINVSAESQVEGLEILRDKDLVDAASWNVALPIDGGKYTVTAHAPGSTEWTTSVTIGAEGDTKTVDIPKLKTLAPQPVVEHPMPAASASSSVSAVSQPEVPGTSTSKTLPLALGIGAIALGGGALGFELWAESTYNDAKAEMTSQSRRDSQYSSANTERHVAQGVGIAGLAAAGAAVWLYLHGREASPTVTAKNHELMITPTGIALVGKF